MTVPPLPHPGGDLCEVRAALHSTSSASGGAELPGHRHTQRDAPGGEVREAPSWDTEEVVR